MQSEKLTRIEEGLIIITLKINQEKSQLANIFTKGVSEPMNHVKIKNLLSIIKRDNKLKIFTPQFERSRIIRYNQ